MAKQNSLSEEKQSETQKLVNEIIANRNGGKGNVQLKNIKSVKDKKLKRNLRLNEEKMRNSAIAMMEKKKYQTDILAEAGYLEPDLDSTERTFKFSQDQLKKEVNIETHKKLLDLNLPEFGPYQMDYTRNGRHLLLGGSKGHIAALNWESAKLHCELYVNETIKDVCWLHNETMFAVAQKKYTFLYDKTGLELHCLRDHIEVNRLAFLPYHFLLASVGNAGYLKYQDTSTGKLVSEHRSKLGKCNTMALNPYNAIINLGHANGTVTLWSPSMTMPLVKMLCHKGPVQAMALDNSGKYMATAGLDGQLKLWDIRTYKLLDSYFTPTPASHLSFSAKGLLAVTAGPRISVWKDLSKTKQKEAYMTHLISGSRIQDSQFCPFEDILGVGHTTGFSSLIIPGSGEAVFDTFEANPYQTTKQRQESEVHALLEKIQPDMITLDPSFVGKLDRAPAEVIKDEAQREWEANHPGQKFVPQKRARGKSSSQRRYLRKQANVVDEKRMEVKERIDRDIQEKEKARLKARGIEVGEKKKTALDRFVIN